MFLHARCATPATAVVAAAAAMRLNAELDKAWRESLVLDILMWCSGELAVYNVISGVMNEKEAGPSRRVLYQVHAQGTYPRLLVLTILWVF